MWWNSACALQTWNDCPSKLTGGRHETYVRINPSVLTTPKGWGKQHLTCQDATSGCRPWSWRCVALLLPHKLMASLFFLPVSSIRSAAAVFSGAI